MKKGQMITYRSGQGFLYSALVLRTHRDGTATVRLYFPIRDGVELRGCFQGDVFRIGPENVVTAHAQAA